MRIAFFDFDGTITTKDTLLEFIKYSKGVRRFYLGFLLNSPWLVAYRLKLISNQRAKERILRFFFRNSAVAAFQEQCDAFAADILPGLVRSRALEEIACLQRSGSKIVVVSASPENWISGWCEKIGAALLATRLETTGKEPGLKKISGNILGANCHGEEKVRRIRQSYTLAEYVDIYTYGDTRGDRPMLGLGTVSFYKPFR